MQSIDSVVKVYQSSREMFAVESNTYIDMKFIKFEMTCLAKFT